MSKKILATVMIAAVALLVVALPVLAQTSDENLELLRTSTGFGNVELVPLIGAIINIILGFLGVVAVLIVLYGGFIWMTAMGDETKTKKSKDLIFAGIIGLVIIFAAFAIASFVLSSLGTATEYTAP